MHIYTKLFFALLLFSTQNNLLYSQEKEKFSWKKSWPVRYVNSMINDTSAKSEPKFIAYPIVAYAPETNLELGVSSLYVRYAKRDTNNRLSEINTFAFYTLAGQYGLVNEHAIYSDKNKWFVLGKLKTQSYPLSYWGIGAATPNIKLAKVDAFQFQFKERFLRKIVTNIYGGLELDYQQLSSVKFKPFDNQIVTLPYGYEGAKNFGVGTGLLYDNRHNVLNVRHGFFAEAAVLYYGLLSTHEFSTLSTDIRWFHPIRKRNVLAFQAISQVNFGHSPFNQLALMGGENMMRGYYLGRYRDNSLFALQGEYRMLPFSFAKRFGASVFASTGTVSSSIQNMNLSNFQVAGGAGIRFLIFPKKDVWTRIDVAFTKEGYGFYIFVGEAF